jgi:dTDP-4-dehydrorhamnose 3,5-epimerase
MKFTETAIKGVYLIEIKRLEDERGFFGRAWCRDELVQQGLDNRIAQVNVGFSPKAGTLRGMHYQRAPHAEVKLVRCTLGAVYDVALDLRPESPTFRKWFAVELNAENRLSLYIPEGCAHGYQTLAADSEIYYFTSALYAPDHATGVRFDDPAFGIEWPLPVSLISDGDRYWPDFEA